MATSVSTIQARIQARGYATDTAAAQLEMIASLYRRVNGMRRWPFLEVVNDTTMSTVVGQEAYDLKTGITDFLHLEAIRLEAAQTFIEPYYRRPQEFRRFAHASRDNQEPRIYTKMNSLVRFWPLPDKVYTINVDYIKEPPILDDGADVILWPDTYGDILTWGVITELCFRERDAEGSIMAKGHYDELLHSMMVEFNVRQRQQSDRVAESRFYDRYDWRGFDFLWPTY